MQPSTLAKRGSILLFLAVIAFYFYGLGHLPLLGPDEPRYAQVAREMFLRHDLITPTLGGHLWFEKPALLYWMMIVSFKLFGVSEWSARLPAAVSGVLTVAAVFCVASRGERNSRNEQLPGIGFFGFYSALASATSLGIVAFSRAASFDIILTMTTTWALAFFILHEFEETANPPRTYLVGFYAFVGLSLLAKGLLGIVIPIGVIGAYYLFRRGLPPRNTIFSLFWGIPLALGIAGTWYLPVIWRHGWPFIDQFFIQQHFARYITNKYHHARPVYYYLLIFPLWSLPWTAFLFDGLLRARTWSWRGDNRSGDPINKLLVFALGWLLFPLIFFSFSNSKLPGYILPVLPAAALVVGERLSRLGSDSGNSTWAIRATAALCLLLAIAAPIYGWRSGNLSASCGLMLVAPLGIAGTFGLLSARRQMAVVFVAAATFGVLIVVLSCAPPQLAERESAKHLLQVADSRGYSQTAIYGLQRGDRTPEFYAAGRVVYGPDGEPIMYEGPEQVVHESHRRNEALLVFVPLEDVSKLTGLGSVEADVIGNNRRFAIVAVRAH